ncbi:unnamed protein product [Protopolystoma xenopodis]|uniref:Uncharacterized protein n=1 Tax=Protopolystoma xenopodis TaxID=117903 RepID=A0A3S5BYJ1_9PLAT|nr:unnamed protein product [Protopolystoma xenopodis]
MLRIAQKSARLSTCCRPTDSVSLPDCRFICRHLRKPGERFKTAIAPRDRPPTSVDEAACSCPRVPAGMEAPHLKSTLRWANGAMLLLAGIVSRISDSHFYVSWTWLCCPSARAEMERL